MYYISVHHIINRAIDNGVNMDILEVKTIGHNKWEVMYSGSVIGTLRYSPEHDDFSGLLVQPNNFKQCVYESAKLICKMQMKVNTSSSQRVKS